ncbi:TPR repeat region-containing protein [Mycolicibacterium sp. XJ870]
MGALDAFYSTWSNARETFGQGNPQDGAEFDGSSKFQQARSAVEAAAPGSNWLGPAAEAYGAKNKEHAAVFGKLADLDKRMATEVTNAANVVTAGRQNLDEVKSWVTSMANSLPNTSAADRDSKLMQIANSGISKVSDIVQKSTDDMNTIGRRVQTIKGEFQALGNQLGSPKENPADPNKLPGDESKAGEGELKPEDMQGLVQDALKGNQEAAAKVDQLLNGIDEEQLGPNSEGHPLDPVQAELIGQLQAQMKPMSLADLNAARERLGPHKNILPNAMHVMSDPDVTYPRHDGDGPQVVTPGKIPNDGVLPGDTGALPDGVQAVLNERGDFLGPTAPVVGYPGSQADLEAAERHAAAGNLKNLADIVGEGDSKFQQGSQLDREMMSNAKEWLAAQEAPGGGQEHWGDEVVERVFDTAGRDTVVNHDMFTNDKDFVEDVLTHDWQDGAQSARTLTDWIAEDAYSTDPVVNERAGETASALADYIGDPANKQTLMDIDTGAQQNVAFGKLNPELAESLARAMSPYVDEMAGRDIDGTSGWTPKDSSADLSYPHAANVMGVLGTGDVAAEILDGRSASVQGAYINQYANSVIETDGHSVDSDAMAAAGRLKGITDEGAFMAISDTESDAVKARQAAWDRQAVHYDAAKDLLGIVPHVSPLLSMEATLMKDAILGPRPETAEPGHTPIESSHQMRSALASVFLGHNIGDPGDAALLRSFDKNGDGQLEIPNEDPYNPAWPRYQNALENYYSRLSDNISDPLDAYDEAYRDALK